MNLAQVIHQRWAAAAALNALLPAARVYTGMSVDPTVPFATINKESEHPAAYLNDGSSVATVGLRIDVFHAQHDAAAAIVAQIKAVFDRSAFALAGSDKVVDVLWVNDFERQTADSVWQCTCELNCTVQLAAGQ
jgi:hypothetical protein